MKLKSIILTTLLLSVTLALQAQRKPKSAYEATKWVYKRLPLKPLSSEIKTYHARVKVKDGDIRDEPQDLAEEYLVIPGLKKQKNQPDLNLLVTLKGFEVDGKKLKSKKKGSLSSASIIYYYQFRCLYPMKLRITDKNGEEIYTKKLASADKIFSYDAKAFSSKSQAEEDYEENRRKYKRLAETQIKNQLFGKVKKLIESYYAKMDVNLQLQVGYAKGSKKRFDFADLNKAKRTMQSAIRKLNSSGDANEDFKSAIEIYQKALKESKPDEKRARVNRKVTAMLHYNMSLAYFLINDFKQAMTHVDQAIETANGIGGLLTTDYTKSYSLKLSELIEDKKARMGVNGK